MIIRSLSCRKKKRKLYEALVIKQIDVNLYKEQKALIEQRLLEVQNTKAVVMTRLEAEQQEKERQHQQKMYYSLWLKTKD